MSTHTNATDSSVTSTERCTAPLTNMFENIAWEQEEDTEKYIRTLNFSELSTKVVYKVTPVKVIVRKFGPQLLMEVEDMNDPKHESFPVFAPNNYRERVKNLCGSSMTPHMLKYNGMESKNNRKIHNYKLAKFIEVKQEDFADTC